MADTFIFHADWIDDLPDNVDGLTKAKIIFDICNYGSGKPLMFEDDGMVSAVVNTRKRYIDKSIADYEAKVKMAKIAGRKKKVDDSTIRELAR